MNKKLLSLLLALPLVAMQIYGNAEVSLGDPNTNVEDGLFPINKDIETAQTKLATLTDLKKELVVCENEAADGLQRTIDMLRTTAARLAAKAYNDFVMNCLRDDKMSLNKIAAAAQELKNIITAATDKAKMNNQELLKLSAALKEALKTATNPRANLE